MNKQTIISDVRNLYLEILKREPDSQGLLHFVNKIVSGELTIFELENLLNQSREKKLMEKIKIIIPEYSKDKSLSYMIFEDELFPIFGSIKDMSVFTTLIQTKGYYEYHIHKHLKNIVKSDFSCLDVGANIGVFTIALQYLLSTGKILSVEPAHLMYKYLLDNLAANHCHNKVVPYNNAFSSLDDSIISINYDLNILGSAKSNYFMGENSISEKIQTINIEKLLEQNKLRKFDLMKIDIEGYEFAALEKQSKILENKVEILITEVNSKDLNDVSHISDIEYLKFLRSFYSRIYLFNRINGDLELFEGNDLRSVTISEELFDKDFIQDIICFK